MRVERPSFAAAPPLLSCERISFRYHERFVALEEVSLELRAGERLVLLGANGSGKSTLLKLLAGVVFPTSGTLRAFGAELTSAALEEPERSRAFRSRVGLVFQNPEIQLFCPTVAEEVAFGCHQLALAEAEVDRRVADVLQLMEIADLAERSPFQLSEGQKKRVALASVLAMNPEVLLLDEPAAGLDPKAARALEQVLDQLHASGKTLVEATHALDGLERRADRCAVFSTDHRLLYDGPARPLLADRALLREANLIA